MIYDIGVHEGATLATGPPKKLFQTKIGPSLIDQVSGYAVAANGQKFLLIEPVETQQTQQAEPIQVIVNWDAALAK